jgi:hypothetical protein
LDEKRNQGSRTFADDWAVSELPEERWVTGGPVRRKVMPLGCEMSPSEREACERRYLSEFERLVSNNPASPHQFHDVREVRFDGSYPETALSVRWRDTRTGRERENSWHLWISPVTGRPPGLFESPEGRELPKEIAFLVWVWMSEA